MGDRIVTWPNALSAARLAGVPVFLWLVIGPRTPEADLIACGMLGLAGLSDWLDGKLARALNQVSELGKMLDPAADRLYILATIIGLAVRSIIPWWLLALLVGRELIVGIALVVLRVPAPRGPAVGVGVAGLEADQEAVRGRGVDVAARERRLERDRQVRRVAHADRAVVTPHGEDVAARAREEEAGRACWPWRLCHLWPMHSVQKGGRAKPARGCPTMVRSSRPVVSMRSAWLRRLGREKSSAVRGMVCLSGRAPRQTQDSQLCGRCYT